MSQTHAQQGVVVGDAAATPQATLDVRGDARIVDVTIDNQLSSFLMYNDATGILHRVDANTLGTGAMTWNGTTWVLQPDENTTYTAGNGITIGAAPANEIAIAPGGNAGNILVWDGNQWNDQPPAVSATTDIFTNSAGVSINNGAGAAIGSLPVEVVVDQNSASGAGLLPAPTGADVYWATDGTGTPAWRPVPASGIEEITVTGGLTVTNPTGPVVSLGLDIQTEATLTGNGTGSNPLGIAQQGAAAGQVLEWNGTTWAPADDDNDTYTPGPGINITAGNVIENTFSLTGGTDISVTGTFPNLTVNYTGTSGGGDLTEVTGSQGIVITNGTGPIPDIGLPTGAAGEVLTWDAGTGEWESQPVPETDYTGLGEVNVNTATNDISLNTGDVTTGSGILNLTGDFSGAAVGSGFGIELNPGLADGHVLTWNSAINEWESQPSGSGADDWGSAVINHAPNTPFSGDGTPTNPLAFVSGGADGHVLTWNAGTSQWESQPSVPGADNWGTQVAQTDASLQGDGTSSSPLGFADGSAPDDVWLWDGTSWSAQAAPETDYTGLGELNVNTTSNEISLNTGDVSSSSSMLNITGDVSGAAVGSGFAIDLASGGADGHVLTWNAGTSQW
ncbi:MAG: hypothetical protein ACOCZ8_00350, partial [Bacteroidota bacterium]